MQFWCWLVKVVTTVGLPPRVPHFCQTAVSIGQGLLSPLGRSAADKPNLQFFAMALLYNGRVFDSESFSCCAPPASHSQQPRGRLVAVRGEAILLRSKQPDRLGAVLHELHRL